MPPRPAERFCFGSRLRCWPSMRRCSRDESFLRESTFGTGGAKASVPDHQLEVRAAGPIRSNPQVHAYPFSITNNWHSLPSRPPCPKISGH